jgi:hypothetical protein
VPAVGGSRSAGGVGSWPLGVPTPGALSVAAVVVDHDESGGDGGDDHKVDVDVGVDVGAAVGAGVGVDGYRPGLLSIPKARTGLSGDCLCVSRRWVRCCRWIEHRWILVLTLCVLYW